jgi:quercetin dioxygenase-like cupin family protein
MLRVVDGRGRRCTMATSGDAVQVAPDVYTTVLENERVRVLDLHLRPGAKSALHAHPDYVAYFLTPGTVRFTAADGTSREVDIPTGAVWRGAHEHAVENIGATEVRGIFVELK